jgi:hypothetical protein
VVGPNAYLSAKTCQSDRKHVREANPGVLFCEHLLESSGFKKQRSADFTRSIRMIFQSLRVRFEAKRATKRRDEYEVIKE